MFTVMTTYPFVIGGFVHDPFIHAAKSTVLEKGFCRGERSRVGVPQRGKFAWIAVHNPAAVTNDTCYPMTFFRMVDALPFMGAAGGFCRWRSWSCFRFRWLRFWIGRF